MVDISTARTGRIDLSFIPSLRCDLHCPHCQYAAGPSVISYLSLHDVKDWLRGVCWDDIHAAGFYGGEPALEPAVYGRFIDLVPPEVPRFVITNGTWSRDWRQTNDFIAWVAKHQLHVFVSGTRWHRLYQDRSVLRQLRDSYGFRLKGEEDTILQMGRARGWAPPSCTNLCTRWAPRPWRIALHPTKGVIFQSCDGDYPTLQSFYVPFREVAENIAARIESCRSKPCGELSDFMRSHLLLDEWDRSVGEPARTDME